MYFAYINKFTEQVVIKSALLTERPMAMLIGGMLAGAYVGIGIILIMTIGNEVPATWQKLVMGSTFGIALTLVIFAGSELFTGYAMYGAWALLQKKLSVGRIVYLLTWVWFANLAGAVLLVAIYKMGHGTLLEQTDTVLHQIAYKKMNSSAPQLFANGVLCNWLVCLAIWMSAKMSGDAAKCIVIFWCLLAFIASGFEHCVANMTVFALVLMGPDVAGITYSGALFNLGWVTLGNIVGGAVLVAYSYWVMSRSEHG